MKLVSLVEADHRVRREIEQNIESGKDSKTPFPEGYHEGLAALTKRAEELFAQEQQLRSDIKAWKGDTGKTHYQANKEVYASLPASVKKYFQTLLNF